ncbi:hypothetical protein [Candidatus Binatus sp.]
MILELEAENPDRMIAVMLPELVERHWLRYFFAQPAAGNDRRPADA